MGVDTFYKTPAQEINNLRYAASVPFAYQPNMPEFLRTGRGRTIVNYNDPNNRQNMDITISQMLDITENGLDFVLFRAEDIYNVFRTLDMYLIGSQPSLEARSLAHILYAKKIVDFREKNFVAFQIAVLANDGIMNEIIEIYGHTDAFSQIFGNITIRPEDFPNKKEYVKELIRTKVRRPPIDLALLNIETPTVEDSEKDPLDVFLKDDLPGVGEDYITDLYGKS